MHPPVPPPITPPAPAAEPPLDAFTTTSLGRRTGTALWRLAVAGCAFYGFYEVAFNPVFQLANLWFLSQSGSLIAAVLYALFAITIILPGGFRLERFVAWLRGSLACTMILICLVSIFFLNGGDLDQIGFLFEHLITPLVVVADVTFIGVAQLRAKWWQPLTWTWIGVAYLIIVNVSGEGYRLYGGMLDWSGRMFIFYLTAFLAIAIVFGYLLFGIIKLRKAIRGSNHPTPQQPVGPPPPAGPGQTYGGVPQQPVSPQYPQPPAPQYPPPHP